MKFFATIEDEESWGRGEKGGYCAGAGGGIKREREREGRIEGGKNRGEKEAFLATDTL